MTLTSLAVGQTEMAFCPFDNSLKSSADSETFCGQTHIVFRNKGKDVPGFVNFFTIKLKTMHSTESTPGLGAYEF